MNNSDKNRPIKTFSGRSKKRSSHLKRVFTFFNDAPFVIAVGQNSNLVSGLVSIIPNLPNPIDRLKQLQKLPADVWEYNYRFISNLDVATIEKMKGLYPDLTIPEKILDPLFSMYDESTASLLSVNMVANDFYVSSQSEKDKKLGEWFDFYVNNMNGNIAITFQDATEEMVTGLQNQGYPVLAIENICNREQDSDNPFSGRRIFSGLVLNPRLWQYFDSGTGDQNSHIKIVKSLILPQDYQNFGTEYTLNGCLLIILKIFGKEVILGSYYGNWLGNAKTRRANKFKFGKQLQQILNVHPGATILISGDYNDRPLSSDESKLSYNFNDKKDSIAYKLSAAPALLLKPNIRNVSRQFNDEVINTLKLPVAYYLPDVNTLKIPLATNLANLLEKFGREGGLSTEEFWTNGNVTEFYTYPFDLSDHHALYSKVQLV